MEKIKNIRKPLIVGICIVIVLVLLTKSYFPIHRTGVDTNGIQWDFNILTKTLTFTNTKASSIEMPSYYEIGDAPWDQYRNKCKKIVFGKGIIFTGENTFSEYKNLSSVIMSDDMNQIGMYAFFKCEKLKKFTCPKNLKTIHMGAFAHSGLETIEFNSNLKTINQEVFEGTKIKKIEIPNQVTKISIGAFYGMENLEEVILPSTIEEMGSTIFDGDIELKKVHIKAKKILSATETSFYGLNPNVVIEVPKESLNEYQENLYEWGLPKTARIIGY